MCVWPVCRDVKLPFVLRLISAIPSEWAASRRGHKRPVSEMYINNSMSEFEFGVRVSQFLCDLDVYHRATRI